MKKRERACSRYYMKVLCSRLSVCFVIPSYANLVTTEATPEIDTASKTASRIEQIKNNNKERIKQIEESLGPKTVEEQEKKSIIDNIKKQVTLDIDDTKTIRKEDQNSESQADTQTGRSHSTGATDISLIKKYGGFKGYQQALLLEVTDDLNTMTSLDRTLNALQIQELTSKYSDIQSQYLRVIGQKEFTDDTHRQLLLAMKLTEHAISDTIGSINKRSVKMMFLFKKLEESKKKLQDIVPDLLQTEKDLITYTQSLYKMNHDIFQNNDISEIKLFTKSDNVAQTLASDHITKELTIKIDTLLQDLSKRKIQLVRSYDMYEQQHTDLEQQKLLYLQEKETLQQQIDNYDEFMLYVKSNKAYIDEKKNQLEEEKKTLGKEKELISLLQDADSTQELDAIKEKLKEELGDEDIIFNFPIENVTKITSFYEDEGYNALFGVDHHLALDFRLAQGADVYAPADGYVYKVINQNSSMLNWFILLHQNNFATVYLHMQDTFVQEGEYVYKGDIIGLGGGTPGTRGAGHMTTGPHLHWEVWKDAKVVDPLLYTDLSGIKSPEMLQQRHKEKRENDNESE